MIISHLSDNVVCKQVNNMQSITSAYCSIWLYCGLPQYSQMEQ